MRAAQMEFEESFGIATIAKTITLRAMHDIIVVFVFGNVETVGAHDTCVILSAITTAVHCQPGWD